MPTGVVPLELRGDDAAEPGEDEEGGAEEEKAGDGLARQAVAKGRGQRGQVHRQHGHDKGVEAEREERHVDQEEGVEGRAQRHDGVGVEKVGQRARQQERAAQAAPPVEDEGDRQQRHRQDKRHHVLRDGLRHHVGAVVAIDAAAVDGDGVAAHGRELEGAAAAALVEDAHAGRYDGEQQDEDDEHGQASGLANGW